MSGALLVAGTSSDAGKSVVVAGMCRWLARQGVSVAPFKGQNMALNAAVTADGAEIGRAQAAQAAAAGIPPEAAMNPILIKPTGDRHSQVIVMGRPAFDVGARDYHQRRPELLPIVLDALADLRRRFDVVICEGAGSPTEINLRQHDLTNMGLARAAGLPVLIVGDIDRGGVFAALHGTIALLEPADQALISGVIINRFRGDPTVLQPGLRQFERLTGRPVLGVLPHVHGLRFDGEDSLAMDRPLPTLPPLGPDMLDVAVIRLPRASNVTDVDPLTAEPGIRVRFTVDAADVDRADLVVVPGSKHTVGDLAWLRQRGLADALARRAADRRPILGICGGYQLLGTTIHDPIESGAGTIPGLDLLPVDTTFEPSKVVRDRQGTSPRWDVAAGGYEIRHGRVTRRGGDPWLRAGDGEDEGCVVGTTFGTSWHGVLDHDALRRALLAEVAGLGGRDWVPGHEPFAVVRGRWLDQLGDLVADHLDTAAIERLLEHGPPRLAPVVLPAGAPDPDEAALDVARGANDVVPGLRDHGDRQVPPGTVDLAVNVETGPPPWLRDRLASAVAELGTYPDDQAARVALAARHGRDPDEIVPLAGAADGFWLLPTVLRPRLAACVHPGFTEGEAALRASGVPVVPVWRDPDTAWRLAPNDVPDAADLVLLGRPDNPTGVVDAVGTIEALVRPGRTVVVDEAFVDFLPDAAGLAGRRDLPGLVVLRSITKLWGIPGLRAGWLVADADIAVRFAAARQPWSVGHLPLVALAATTEPRADDDRRLLASATARDRAHLVAALRALPGVTAWDSAANFVLAHTPLADLRERLLADGFAVRRGDTFPGLTSHHVRVAVRSPGVSDALAAAIRRHLDAMGSAVLGVGETKT